MLKQTRVEIRAVEVAEYIAETHATVRQAAKLYGVSKSTIYKDVTERLVDCDYSLFLEVQDVLQENKSTRHLRGGLATQRRWAALEELKKAI